MPAKQQINIELTPEHLEALKLAMQTGSYTSQDEVIREALDEWQERRNPQFTPEQIEKIREMLAQAKASGPSRPLDWDELRREAEERYKSKLKKHQTAL